MKKFLSLFAVILMVSCATQPQPKPPVTVHHIVTPSPVAKAKIVEKKKEAVFNKAVKACSEYEWHLDGCIEIDKLVTQKKQSADGKRLEEKKRIDAEQTIQKVIDTNE